MSEETNSKKNHIGGGVAVVLLDQDLRICAQNYTLSRDWRCCPTAVQSCCRQQQQRIPGATSTAVVVGHSHSPHHLVDSDLT